MPAGSDGCTVHDLGISQELLLSQSGICHWHVTEILQTVHNKLPGIRWLGVTGSRLPTFWTTEVLSSSKVWHSKNSKAVWTTKTETSRSLRTLGAIQPTTQHYTTAVRTWDNGIDSSLNFTMTWVAITSHWHHSSIGKTARNDCYINVTSETNGQCLRLDVLCPTWWHARGKS